MRILELLSNRRIWAGIFGAITFILPLFGVTFELNQELPTLFTDFFITFSALATAVLPILSYLKPKK